MTYIDTDNSVDRITESFYESESSEEMVTNESYKKEWKGTVTRSLNRS